MEIFVEVRKNLFFCKKFIAEILGIEDIRVFSPFGSFLGSEPIEIVKITKGFEFGTQCPNAPMRQCPDAVASVWLTQSLSGPSK